MSTAPGTWQNEQPSSSAGDPSRPTTTARASAFAPGRPLWHTIRRTWSWLHRQNRLVRKDRRLRVSETVSLGDKRFISLVEVDGRSYLIGGGAGGVNLLTALPPVSTTCPEMANTGPQDVPSPNTFQRALGDAWKEVA